MTHLRKECKNRFFYTNQKFYITTFPPRTLPFYGLLVPFTSMCLCSVTSVTSDSLGPHVRHLCPLESPGKNTGVCCHLLLQGIFPTQGSNSQLLCLLHCRQILYPLSHLGSLPLHGSYKNLQRGETPWVDQL